MKVLKISFYKHSKKTKSKCAAKFHNSTQFTIDELETAKRLIEFNIKLLTMGD